VLARDRPRDKRDEASHHRREHQHRVV
jgi:hypothetical protein